MNFFVFFDFFYLREFSDSYRAFGGELLEFFELDHGGRTASWRVNHENTGSNRARNAALPDPRNR